MRPIYLTKPGLRQVIDGRQTRFFQMVGDTMAYLDRNFGVPPNFTWPPTFPWQPSCCCP